MYIRKIRKNAQKPLRQDILSAAREMILKDGYQNLSMRRIASAVGYSPTTLYTYFKNKDDILYMICDETYAQLGKIINNAVAPDLFPAENLRNCMLAYADFALENSDSYRIAFMVPAAVKNNLSFLEKGTNIMNAYETVVDLAAQYAETPDDAHIIAQSAWSVMHGIASNMILHPHFPWADRSRLIETAADAFINGLRSDK